MNFEASQHIQRELTSGESLLWAGRPKQGLTLRPSDGRLIPISLLWGGFAIYWEYSVFIRGGPGFFLLFGGAFALVGLYVIFGRFVVDAFQRRKTYYGVSSDRVIISTEFPVSRIKSLDLKGLSEISLSSGSGQFGSIHFGAQTERRAALPGFEGDQNPCFELIADAKAVYDRIRELHRKAS